MSMTRSEFNETFRSVISEEFADIPPESEIQYEFSKEFLDKMQKLINVQRMIHIKRKRNTALP